MTAPYVVTGKPAELARGLPADMRNEFALIAAGINAFPLPVYAPNYAADSGSANAYAVTLSPVPASYTAGMIVSVKITNANTTASTLNVNALGTKSIKRPDGTDPVANDLLAGQVAFFVYDGTNFQLFWSALAAANAAAASASSASGSASTATTQASNASSSATLASQWADLTSGQVAATDYSSKAYAIGGTGVTGAAGAAKEWATRTSGAVDGGTGYSAKQWATKATTTVDGSLYSAYQYALNAAASAASIGFSLSTNNTWTGIQTFTNSYARLLGSSTGYTTLTSANAGASNYTITVPAVTDTMSVLGAETWTGDKTLAENVGIVLDAALSADGKYSGIVEAGTSSAALAFGEVCYRVTATGKWALARAAAADVGTVVATGQLGMCVLAAGGADATTTMLLFGKVRADALFDTFTVGAPVYLSAATAGKTVSAAPTGTTDFTVRKLGFAEDANTVFFNPSNDYITLA